MTRIAMDAFAVPKAVWPSQLVGVSVDWNAVVALIIGCIAGGLAAFIFSRMLREWGCNHLCPCFYDEMPPSHAAIRRRKPAPAQRAAAAGAVRPSTRGTVPGRAVR